MRIEHELVTPARAAELLRLNHEGQRRVRQTVSDRYVADMAACNWRETGDTIKIDRAGRVVDGQHRLQAVVKANASIWFWIAYDVPDDAYDVLDQGLKRTFADVLQSHGIRSSKLVASAVASVEHYAKWRSFRNGGKNSSIPQLISFWEANRGIEDFASVANSVYAATQFPPSGVTAMLYIFSLTKTEDAELFATSIATGQDLRAGDPTYAARQLLLGRMGTQASRRFNVEHYNACLVRAWNAFAAGGSITNLRGLVNGRFPEVFDPHDVLEIWVSTQEGLDRR